MTYLKKMGMDPTTKEGIARLLEGFSCEEIPDGESISGGLYNCPYHNRLCSECIAKRLLSEAPKRWQKIKSSEDLFEMHRAWLKSLSPDASGEAVEFVKYLCEEVAE